jgi:hypothetical protein
MLVPSSSSSQAIQDCMALSGDSNRELWNVRKHELVSQCHNP